MPVSHMMRNWAKWRTEENIFFCFSCSWSTCSYVLCDGHIDLCFIGALQPIASHRRKIGNRCSHDDQNQYTNTHTHTLTSRRSYRKIEWVSVCVCVVTGQYARQRRLPMTTPNYIVGMTECNYLRLNLDMLCSHSHLILLMLRCCIISKRVYRIHAIHDEAISAYVIKNGIHLAVFCVEATGPWGRYTVVSTHSHINNSISLCSYLVRSSAESSDNWIRCVLCCFGS